MVDPNLLVAVSNLAVKLLPSITQLVRGLKTADEVVEDFRTLVKKVDWKKFGADLKAKGRDILDGPNEPET